ncbi:MAG: DUF3347 domain-containing protein [Deferribacteres bacterium]|nr:DUF3347 domain-containing protein [candidate division KSB1 bacterium]MCB9503169.1 DUF3347 domain-containing protein [Deferribacteres bacterium]
MFKKIIIISVIAFATTLSTAFAQHEHHQHEKEQKKHSEHKMPMKTMPEFKQKELGKAYMHYLHLKSALVASDDKEAGKSAKMLVAALNDIKKMDAVYKDAVTVAAASDLAARRKAFAVLSLSMAGKIKGTLESGEIYVAFCPMANKNQGAYWLSGEKEIKNPYFGDKMLKCGSVKDVIK